MTLDGLIDLCGTPAVGKRLIMIFVGIEDRDFKRTIGIKSNLYNFIHPYNYHHVIAAKVRNATRKKNWLSFFVKKLLLSRHGIHIKLSSLSDPGRFRIIAISSRNE